MVEEKRNKTSASKEVSLFEKLKSLKSKIKYKLQKKESYLIVDDELVDELVDESQEEIFPANTPSEYKSKTDRYREFR